MNKTENEREHVTDIPHCWCNPRKEVQPNGDIVIVHNYKDQPLPPSSEAGTWEEEFDRQFAVYHFTSEKQKERVRTFLKQVLEDYKAELKERLAEIPRIEITHKDGSKTKAILEHSLETHGLQDIALLLNEKEG